MKDNNKKILEDVKLKISISNFEEKEKMEMGKNKKRIIKTAAVASLVIVSLTGVVFAKNIEGFIKNFFGANTSDGVDTAVNNGYVDDINTEYQEANGIEISLNSILMDDFNFDLKFDIKLSENYNINEFEKMEFEDLKVLDETGKIVFDTHTNAIEGKTEEEIKREGHYMGSYSFVQQKIGENEFSVSLSATGNPELFPKSKHLTAEFTKIRTWEYLDNNCEQIKEKFYTGNWHFEIDVPEEFYNRETIIYKAKSCSEDGIDTNQIEATVSKTGFRISIPEIKTNKVDYEALHSSTTKNISDKIALQKEYVETEDGKRFETAQRSDGDGGYGVPPEDNKIINYHQTFNLTSYDATDEITVHIFTNKGEEIIIELGKN